MSPLTHPFSHGEQGFTLIEMLVTLMTGIVIVLAAFSILDVSLHQSSRISERVDADQRARLAMEKIMLELHSSCVIGNNAVEPNSKATEIKFISQEGAAAYFSTVTEHVISLTGGNLVDTSYVSEPSSNGEWKFLETATSRQTLLTNVTQSVNGSETVPIFQYFKYVSGNLSSVRQTVPLSSEEAEKTAEITVAFTTAPTTNEEKGGRSVELTDSAVLRFDPASATGANEPCQ